MQRLQPLVSSIMSLRICVCARAFACTCALLTIPVTVKISKVRRSVLIAIKSAFDHVWYKVIIAVRVDKIPDSITVCEKNERGDPQESYVISLHTHPIVMQHTPTDRGTQVGRLACNKHVW